MLELLLSDILRFLLLWASLGLSLEWEQRTNATCPLAVPLGGGELLMAICTVWDEHTHMLRGWGWRVEALLYDHHTWQSVAQTWPKGYTTNDWKV